MVNKPWNCDFTEAQIQKEIDAKLKLIDLESKIKELFSQYNEIVKENNLSPYIIYTTVNYLNSELSPDSCNDMDTILKIYNENNGWYASSWCLDKD